MVGARTRLVQGRDMIFHVATEAEVEVLRHGFNFSTWVFGQEDFWGRDPNFGVATELGLGLDDLFLSVVNGLGISVSRHTFWCHDMVWQKVCRDPVLMSRHSLAIKLSRHTFWCHDTVWMLVVV